MAELENIVADFAKAIELVDAERPQAVNMRSKKPFQPGIGPHSESQTVELVTRKMVETYPGHYPDGIETGVPYVDLPRQKCDFCIAAHSSWEWAIEVKMLRMLGDNGKPNDNILMHILSPYPEHRSALTDCEKLLASHISGRNAILIYGYEAEEYPVGMAIDAFEVIARTKVDLGRRFVSPFAGLIHPVHSTGKVFAWELKHPYASA